MRLQSKGAKNKRFSPVPKSGHEIRHVPPCRFFEFGSVHILDRYWEAMFIVPY